MYIGYSSLALLLSAIALVLPSRFALRLPRREPQGSHRRDVPEGTSQPKSRLLNMRTEVTIFLKHFGGCMRQSRLSWDFLRVIFLGARWRKSFHRHPVAASRNTPLAPSLHPLPQRSDDLVGLCAVHSCDRGDLADGSTLSHVP